MRQLQSVRESTDGEYHIYDRKCRIALVFVGLLAVTCIGYHFAVDRFELARATILSPTEFLILGAYVILGGGGVAAIVFIRLAHRGPVLSVLREKLVLDLFPFSHVSVPWHEVVLCEVRASNFSRDHRQHVCVHVVHPERYIDEVPWWRQWAVRLNVKALGVPIAFNAGPLDVTTMEMVALINAKVQ